MPLPVLPTEVLSQILQYLGEDFLREDVQRLTINKRWFQLAQGLLYSQLRLSATQLRLLLNPENETQTRALIKKNLKILVLRFQGFDNGTSTFDEQAALTWTVNLDDDLITLAAILTDSLHLRTLDIQAWTEFCPKWPYLPRRDYLSLSTMQSMLNLNHLATLNLDLCGTYLKPKSGSIGNGHHICDNIAALLDTLMNLKLRMRSICTNALKPPQNSFNLPLQTVLVNLSLMNESPEVNSAVHASVCGFQGTGFGQLRDDMEAQAKILVTQMAAPRVVKVFTHSPVHLNTICFDAITNQRTDLRYDAAWDDDSADIEDSQDSGETDKLSLSSEP